MNISTTRVFFRLLLPFCSTYNLFFSLSSIILNLCYKYHRIFTKFINFGCKKIVENHLHVDPKLIIGSYTLNIIELQLNLLNFGDTTMEEILACQLEINLTSELGVSRVTFETDSLEVINTMNDKQVDPQFLDSRSEARLVSFQEAMFCWVRRTVNTVAHMLS